jgi:arylsulfatase
MLSTAGYRTYHSGKWHLDKRPGTGFDRSFSVEDHDRFFSPKRLLLDGQAMPDLTDSTTRPDGFYVTDAIGDYATQFLTSHLDDQADEPFFAYVAFTSPHFPLQAPSETIDTYASQFDEGWDAVRKQRLAKMRSDGLLDTTMSPLEPEIGPPYRFNNLGVLDGKEIFNEIPWSTLTDSQRQFQAAKMRIHAAMIDRMDQQIGRIVTLLRQREVLDDTLILFLSDNGASAEIMIRGDGHDPSKPLGADGSYVCLGPGWSTASNTPFRRHKTWVHEGGISTPLIVSWPNGLASSDEASATVENARQGQSGPITNQVGHVVDVVPTILEACNVPIPKFPVESTTGSPTESTRESPAMRPGTSLLSQFRGGPIIDRELWWCHDGHRAMRQGKWKAIADSAPNGNRLEDAQWHLYDLSTDRTEQRDLAKEEPEQLKTLVEQWTQRIEAMR